MSEYAAEVEVDLEGVGRDAVPRVERRRAIPHRTRGRRSCRMDWRAAPSSRGPARRRQCRARTWSRYGSAEQLVGDLREADDGAGDQLREHGDVAGKVDEVADGSRIAAIDVDRIAHRLERVEADPERKGDPQRRLEPEMAESEPADEGVVAVEAEVEVLEESEQREIRGQRCGEGDARLARGPSFAAGRRDPCPFAVDDEGGDEIDERRSGAGTGRAGWPSRRTHS